jgi:hypothetical protein
MYHLIAQDIVRLFPEGKFIFLWRNPLAVCSSLMESWHGGRWCLYRYGIDLFEGLSNLVDTFETYADRSHAVQYEDLVSDPHSSLVKLFDYLELSFDPSIITAFAHVPLKGQFADHRGATLYQAVSEEPLEKWKHILANPFRKAWCRSYLLWIGKKRLAIMGYSLDNLLAELDAVPYSLRFICSDVFRVPYGAAYRMLKSRVRSRLMNVDINCSSAFPAPLDEAEAVKHVADNKGLADE